MASVSPEEVLKVTDLTSLASRFPNITNSVDDLNKEVRRLKVADLPEDFKSDPVKIWCRVRSYKDSTQLSRFESINSRCSPTIDALIRVESALRWRKEECHNFTVSREMKAKFNTTTVYQIKKEDGFLPDNAGIESDEQ